jgi:hypothetical protein
MKTLLSLLIALAAVVSLACTNTSDESEQATVSPECAKVRQEIANYDCNTTLSVMDDCLFGTGPKTAEQAEWCACAIYGKENLLYDRADSVCW